MVLFKKIRTRFGEWALVKETRNRKRTTLLNNLKNVMVLGLITDASSEQNLDEVKYMYEKLSKQYKQVFILAYVNDKKVPEHYGARYKEFTFFTTKDLDWKFRPIRTDINEFIRQEYELLLDLSMNEYFPLKYIVSASKAKLKVARYTNEENPADIMIDISKNANVKYLIEQIDKYLDMLTHNSK